MHIESSWMNKWRRQLAKRHEEEKNIEKQRNNR